MGDREKIRKIKVYRKEGYMGGSLETGCLFRVDLPNMVIETQKKRVKYHYTILIVLLNVLYI